VLDEVTTHLDAGTILTSVEAFKRYEGALIVRVVTHNRSFKRCVVEEEVPDDNGDDSNGAKEGIKDGVW
jgi:ATPase subunit of ABC transporter with duplicated ATPase domains